MASFAFFVERLLSLLWGQHQFSCSEFWEFSIKDSACLRVQNVCYRFLQAATAVVAHFTRAWSLHWNTASENRDLPRRKKDFSQHRYPHSGPVHTTPYATHGAERTNYTTQGILKTLLSLRKTHQLFSVHTTPLKFENATITGYFGFMFEENLGSEITWLLKPAVLLNSSGLKSVFEKLRFRYGLMWTVGLTVERKLCIQISPA